MLKTPHHISAHLHIVVDILFKQKEIFELSTTTKTNHKQTINNLALRRKEK